MLKILQARLQQHVNRELPDVQAGFKKGREKKNKKGRGTRDQIANIYWIIQKVREFQKNIYFCFKRDGNTRPPDLPLEKPICKSGSNS